MPGVDVLVVLSFVDAGVSQSYVKLDCMGVVLSPCAVAVS